MKFFAPTLVASLGLYTNAEAAGAEFRNNTQPGRVINNVTYPLFPPCEALKAAGLTHVYQLGEPEYDVRKTSYWSVSAQLNPICVVLPLSTQEVSTTIKILQDPPTKFAVRSGGHTTWAGSNNINGGVTVDLGFMNSTTYYEGDTTARIRPGARWGSVYGVLEPYGLTVAGGRASSVGVAGFLTGGGNTFFTAQRGWGCDQVKNYEVVLANGDIINVNNKNNTGLFKALKGGSSNFGIVTAFDMEVFKQGNLWGGSVTYSKNYTQQHIDAYIAWTSNVKNYPEGSNIIFWSYLPTVKDIIIIGAYEDTAGNVAPAGFDKFTAIPSMSSTMRLGTHKNLTDELEQPAGYRDIWFTMLFKNDRATMKYIVELHEQFVEEWKIEGLEPDFITQCMFQAIPTVFNERSEERGGNVLGLNLVKDDAIMLLFDLAVTTDDSELRGREKIRAYGEKMQAFAAARGTLENWQYLNYADSYQNPLGNYGDENVAKILAAAREFDPTGVFQEQTPGGFKITKAAPAGVPVAPNY
ncbi:GlcD FAD-FMN-containing dehydrogenase [Pyrenophora tritici-repentis]|nr:GlcD FAD-FMN-containing dehydrogenase [Pyrenophora tritici-repentis]